MWLQCSKIFITHPDCQHLFDFICVCLEGEVTFYHYGWKDCATIVFYFFIAIILHAVVQEYLLDVSMKSVWHNTLGTYTHRVLLFYFILVAVWLAAYTDSFQQTKEGQRRLKNILPHICGLVHQVVIFSIFSRADMS